MGSFCMASNMDVVDYWQRMSGTVAAGLMDRVVRNGEAQCPVCDRYLALSPKRMALKPPRALLPKHKRPVWER